MTAPMKPLLLLVTVLAVCSTQLHAQHEGSRTPGTPYDTYLGTVRQTYSRLSGGTATMDQVLSQLRTGRRFRYYYDSSQPYTPQTPAVTEAKRQGDCKAKALWLINKLGDRSVRYVIGKAKPGDKMSHAWTLWANGGTWLVLDPTLQMDVVNADQVLGRKWVAKYSYSAAGAYTH